MPRKILRLPVVLDRTGLSRSTVYLRVTEGRFPRPVSLGARAVGWIRNRGRGMDCPPDRGQPRNQRATRGCESVVVKMTPERDSGVVAIWDWIARHGLILCRPS